MLFFTRNVGKLLLRTIVFIKNFLNYGYLLQKMNRTNIALTPKKETPEKLSDHRPISLYIVSYKFISKQLANRHRLLPKVVSPLQSTFAQNRNIHDNILIAHDILFSFSKHHSRDGYRAINSIWKKHMIGWNGILSKNALPILVFARDW